MSAKLHPTALIDPSARLGANVEVGAYTVIGADVEIGELGRAPPRLLDPRHEAAQIGDVRAQRVRRAAPLRPQVLREVVGLLLHRGRC